MFFESATVKGYKSEDFNHLFNKVTGLSMTWGKTLADDPDFSPVGPLIADIEISAGRCSGNCPMCYKENKSSAPIENMSLETFKKVLAKLPKILGQVALGITDIENNPDIWAIMDHCRLKHVVPNVTVNGCGMTPEVLDKLAEKCGAVAVSHYDDDRCFDTVAGLVARGMTQVNIHKLLSIETYDSCFELLDKAAGDPRLKGLNAVVFLVLKPRGRGVSLTPLRDVEAYKKLIVHAAEKGVSYGFDSCSAPMFLASVEGHENFDKLKTLAEPCESWRFSTYIDVHGQMFPCSFSANGDGIDLLSDAVESVFGVWNSEQVSCWRRKLLGNGCNCPVYDIGPRKSYIEQLEQEKKYVHDVKVQLHEKKERVR